ncbi:hypothetical protein [Deinococcus aestuarii]|uniref:hypothetical protein n=1 Tax=Deinococcus aestuarii TaxID=2774531 RepID=UPI001C0ADDF0|nr:hypothetical protein [Deinococcus aestuarii]
MSWFRRRLVPLFTGLLVLALGGCAPRAERAGCPRAQQFGTPGAEWRLCPLDTLPHRGARVRLAGLGLGHTLTLAELHAALEQAPVQVRVAYFAAGKVRGTWAEPQAQPASVALADLEEWSRASAADAQTWTRRAARQVIEAKALGQVLGRSVQPEVAARQLETFASLRYGVLNLVREHQGWLDARDVIQGRRGWVCSLQVAGTPEQLGAFARRIGAPGFTFDRAELFNSLRPADPPDLRARLARQPGTLGNTKLLRLGRAAFHNLGLSSPAHQ